MKRLLLSALVACLALAQAAFADEPFRLHRYSAFQALSTKNGDYLFMGNSITNMHEWQESLGCDPRIKNRGNSGGFTHEIIDNLETYLYEKPARVFIGIGTNDLGVGKTPEYVQQQLSILIRRIKLESPETQITLSSIHPRGSSLAGTANVKRTNELLAQLCAAEGVAFIDTQSALAGIVNYDTSLTFDGLHLNSNGYRLWLDLMEPQIGIESVYHGREAELKANNAAILAASQWNASLRMRQTYFNAFPVTADDVLIVGDEMIHGGEWAELLQNTHIKNRGSGWGWPGPDMACIKQSIPYILHDNAAPRQIVLYAGASEVQAASGDLSAAQASYTSIVEDLKQRTPGTKLTLVGLLPCNTAATNTSRTVLWNTFVKSVADANGCDYVDAYTPFVTEAGTPDAAYMNGNYLYAKGYVRLANLLAAVIDGCTPLWTDDTAAQHIALIAARKQLGDKLTQLLSVPFGSQVGQYADGGEAHQKVQKAIADAAAILSTNGTATTAYTDGATAVAAVLSSLGTPNMPVADADHWYRLSTVRYPSMWITNDPTLGLSAQEAISTKGDAWWRFESRADGAYDIVSHNGDYIIPGAAHNSQLATATTPAASGWTLGSGATMGTFIVASGTTQWNQTNKGDHNAKLFNWGGGSNANDAGCQVYITEVSADELATKQESSDMLPINMSCGTLNRAGYAATWTSTQTTPFVYTMSCPQNNFWVNECNATQMVLSAGTAMTATYTFSVSSTRYTIRSYSFRASAATANTITPNGGTAISLTAEPQLVRVTVDSAHQPQFVLKGDNKAVVLTDLQIEVTENENPAEPQFNVFEYGSPGNTICYRIPAIATAYNGDVIAVADYRYGGADIGFGRVSLHARISKDNGQTWGDKIVVAESHQGQYGVDKPNDLEAGFGDPAIVADRESPNVLLLSCCGNVSYPGGTWEHHQGIARFRSSDNGATWSQYEDMAPHIYQQFKDAGVDVQALFIGSGRIFQSRFTKVGQYYRLYAVCLLRTSSQGGLNYVLYSDDFGQNWQILGDDATPGVTGGDEPKAEELPDGSVLLSSRTYGRIFNIFQFTDVKKGEGSWMQQAWSDGNSTNGTVAQGNSCNGEIMILPVVRKSDNKKMWLALQSVPFGPGGRYNVGIYYKGLASYAAYATPTAFANNWEGRHQASYMSSAYSTMTLQHDGGIGFLYEEDTFGRSYTIVYKNYSIETITDDAYTLDTEAVDPFVLTADGIEAKTAGLTFSNYVGGIYESQRAEIEAAVAAFKAAPSAEAYVKINSVVAAAERVPLNPAVQYVLRNVGRGAGANAMSVPDATTLKLASSPYDATDAKQQWSLIPANGDGTWYIYNDASKSYVMNTLAVEVDMYTTTDVKQAGTYRIAGQDDRLYMASTAPASGGYPAIHLPGNIARMVCWLTSSEASLWYFEATDVPAIDATHIQAQQAQWRPASWFDMQGRRLSAPLRHGIYIAHGKKVVR